MSVDNNSKYLLTPVPAETLMKNKLEENQKLQNLYIVKFSAGTGDRSYFYQIFMRRKQPIPLQVSELF